MDASKEKKSKQFEISILSSWLGWVYRITSFNKYHNSLITCARKFRQYQIISFKFEYILDRQVLTRLFNGNGIFFNGKYPLTVWQKAIDKPIFFRKHQCFTIINGINANPIEPLVQEPCSIDIMLLTCSDILIVTGLDGKIIPNPIKKFSPKVFIAVKFFMT